MKKKIVLLMLLAVVATSSYVGFNNLQTKDVDLSNLYLDQCEALADCEVWGSNHNIIARCVGDEGVCHKVSDNLYCPGKKVN